MQETGESEWLHTLELPLAKAYAVDDVLNAISAVVRPFNDDTNNYKNYLIERLLEAVVEKKFELRDVYLEKVVAPPINIASGSTEISPDSPKQSLVKSLWRFLNKTFTRPPEPAFVSVLETPSPHVIRSYSRPVYKTDLWWARMTYILKRDLVEFCSGQCIRVKFEAKGEQKESQGNTAQISSPSPDGNVVPPVATQPVQELAISGQKALTVSKYSPAEPESQSKSVDKSKSVDQALQNFDDLPDSASVDVKVVAALFGCSVNTVWRRVRNGQLVAPRRHGERTTRWLVGELREALRAGKQQSSKK
jgi:predicted DNA-binding transcriptional regulator AlpA